VVEVAGSDPPRLPHLTTPSSLIMAWAGLATTTTTTTTTISIAISIAISPVAGQVHWWWFEISHCCSVMFARLSLPSSCRVCTQVGQTQPAACRLQAAEHRRGFCPLFLAPAGGAPCRQDPPQAKRAPCSILFSPQLLSGGPHVLLLQKRLDAPDFVWKGADLERSRDGFIERDA
jgi:hypothetical protein